MDKSLENTPQPAGAACDVLIVDDNPINQAYFSAALAKAGFGTRSAINGLEALDIAGKQRFHVILMDIRMPLMGGYEATQTLRQGAGPNCHTPVVAISAEPLPAGQDHLFADFLIKPVSKQDLLDVASRFVLKKPSEKPRKTIQPSAKKAHNAAATLNPGINQQKSLAAVGNNPEIARRLYAMLVQELPGQLQQMRELNEAGDAMALRELLHRMLGSTSFCGAVTLGQRLREYGHVIKNDDSTPEQWLSALRRVEQAAKAVLETNNAAL